MRHARPEDLAPLEELLGEVRSLDTLTERKSGTFYRGSSAFLHFHVDPLGLFADLKVGGDWRRLPVGTKAQQRAAATAIRNAASR